MKVFIIIWSIFMVLLGTALILAGIKKDDTYYEKLTLRIEKVLREKEAVTASEIRISKEFIEQGRLDDYIEQVTTSEYPLDEKGISLFFYQHDTLKGWTNSGIPMPVYIPDEEFVFNVFNLKNGWYRLVKSTVGDWQIVGLILIKNDYPIQNKFLVRGFPKEYEVTEQNRLTVEEGKYPFSIKDETGGFLLGIGFKDQDEHFQRFPSAAGIFYLLSVIALIVAIYSLRRIQFFKRHKILHIILFAGVAVTGRYYMITEKFPKVIYHLSLFNPEYFASSRWLPSLGDFIFNVVLVTLLLGLIFQRFFKLKYAYSNRFWARVLYILGTSSITGVVSLMINDLFGKLIIDSKISFNLLNLLELDIYSVLGFFLITVLLLNFLIITHFFSRLMARSKHFKFWEVVLFSSISFLMIYAVSFIWNVPDPAQLFFSLVIFLTVAYINFRKPKEITFYSLAPVIFLFTVYATYLLFKYNNFKENETRKVTAIRISEQQDHVAEYLFLDIEKRLQEDPLVNRFLLDNENVYPPEFFDHIAQNYFSGYWSKYALVITAFPYEQWELQKDTDFTDPDLVYFEDNINDFGRPTSSDNLFFIDNNTGKVNYIARIPLEVKGREEDRRIIYIEFISKVITQIAGFPELLLDKSIKKPVDLSGYSYAVYKGNNLNISGGDYIFPLHPDAFGDITEEFIFKSFNHFNHLFYKSGDKLIMISKPVNSWQDFVNPFAYLLIFFISILLVYYTLRFVFQNEKKVLRFSFKTRIQLSILTILIASLVVIGFGIYFYIIDQFNRKNNRNITEKLNSILNELDESLNQPRNNAPDLNYFLNQLSNIFFTDINIYDTRGYLVASSRESIYNEGLVSRVMNPQAFQRMGVGKQPSFIHMEKIAAFEYLSAYAAIRGPDGNIVGYLNLPYFLRQKEVREELSASLLALLNIYSLLIALSMIVTFVIANRLTTPLELLQLKLGQIRLGKKNEIIEYRANDEIGGLVAEYNRMIRELENSAELLARSERESAWKEMARQVAHEVKNPLTPMKLSVQYLLKAWEDKRPDFEERLRKFNASMVEQIETLSAIASEFSYFAKMPQALKLEVDMMGVIRNCIEFFHNNEFNVQMTFEAGNLKQAIVLADKDQLVRVFNNVLRNAIQAIPEDREGWIHVTVERTETDFIVKVEDNGTGIPEYARDKIFSPNFTTKNSGMGLGLSMTKTIVENSGGEIYFETRENQGTSFYVKLPAVIPV